MNSDTVVTAARTWLHVKFEHQGRSRHGVDCAGLVICVCRELGLLPADFDVNGYTRQPDGTMFDYCDKHLTRAPISVGGVFVMKFAEEPQHMGFFTPYRHGGVAVIHAVMSNKQVVEHRLDAVWRSRIVRTYKIPGVEE